MFIRYKNGADGLDAVAQVYSKEENKIDQSLVDRNAVSVVKRLNGAGYESYIVGGAVRDLILGRIPKDFDVATAASPRQVHKLFYNSRIIGRRFRIVHITFCDEIIEVSTFRSTKYHDYSNDNQFGTIEEDSARRDFTINSLYYDPIKGNLIDFNNAMEDFKAKRIVSLIPLRKTFIEDPVRMVRAVKYSVKTGFRIPFKLGMAIRHYAPEIGDVSSSRMTEEVNKILASGCSCEVFKRLNQYKLLVHILPAISVYACFPQMFESLKELDVKVNASLSNPSETVSRAQMYLALVQPFISRNEEWTTAGSTFNDVLRQIKVLISPITPPNYELEMAAAYYMESIGMKVPRSCIRHRAPKESEDQIRNIRNAKQGGERPANRRRKRKPNGSNARKSEPTTTPEHAD